MTTAKTTPTTATSGDAAAPAGEFADRITDCPDTDAGVLQAVLLRHETLRRELRLIATGHYDAPEIAAADALTDDDAASREMPLTALELLDQELRCDTTASAHLDCSLYDSNTVHVALYTSEPGKPDVRVGCVGTLESALRRALAQWEIRGQQERPEKPLGRTV